ncbi:MAG: hypothetical protein Q9164_005051, partial [Protoblastenia rupestris]
KSPSSVSSLSSSNRNNHQPTEKALSLIYSPHGVNYSLIRAYASSHLVQNAALPLTLLLHSFDRVNNPWWMGGNVAAGLPGGVEIAKNLMARCWISAHDEDKDNTGISVANVKTRKYNTEEVEQFSAASASAPASPFSWRLLNDQHQDYYQPLNMAAQLSSLRRPVTSAAISALAASIFLPKNTLHAEAPPEEHLVRKPIYDDLALIRNPPKPSSTTSSTTSSTPTDRLASQIRRARIFLHAHTAAAEDRFNAFMSTLLTHERSFTQTIASLAPPPESHERVMPGALYVLVAAMAGSIISRNRNILLRATVPFAVGLGAAWVVLPVTMRNVGDLVWKYEERVPVISINHMRIKGAVEEILRQAKSREEATRKWSDERLMEGREVVEGWVKKGR